MSLISNFEWEFPHFTNEWGNNEWGSKTVWSYELLREIFTKFPSLSYISQKLSPVQTSLIDLFEKNPFTLSRTFPESPWFKLDQDDQFDAIEAYKRTNLQAQGDGAMKIDPNWTKTETKKRIKEYRNTTRKDQENWEATRESFAEIHKHVTGEELPDWIYGKNFESALKKPKYSQLQHNLIKDPPRGKSESALENLRRLGRYRVLRYCNWSPQEAQDFWAKHKIDSNNPSVDSFRKTESEPLCNWFLRKLNETVDSYALVFIVANLTKLTN